MFRLTEHIKGRCIERGVDYLLVENEANKFYSTIEKMKYKSDDVRIICPHIRNRDGLYLVIIVNPVRLTVITVIWSGKVSLVNNCKRFVNPSQLWNLK